jgi:hypothetical protein
MNNKHFTIIKEAYDDFYTELMKRGMMPLKDTGVGFWGISVAEEVYEFFLNYGLNKHKRFLDLGAGDFKVPFIASLFTSESYGIEYDEWLVSQAKRIQTRLNHIPQANKTKIIQGDFMNYDLSSFDVIYWHPDKKSEELNRKLKRELRGKLIVHGPHYHPEGLKKEETYCIRGTFLHVFSNKE